MAAEAQPESASLGALRDYQLAERLPLTSSSFIMPAALVLLKYDLVSRGFCSRTIFPTSSGSTVSVRSCTHTARHIGDLGCCV